VLALQTQSIKQTQNFGTKKQSGRHNSLHSQRLLLKRITSNVQDETNMKKAQCNFRR
jgi:hypothetical protein